MARNIDTDKLKDKIRPYYDKVLHQNISDAEKLAKHDMISDVMFEINEQPTADVREVRQGKWVFKNEGTYNRLRAYCSVCGLHSGIGGIRKNQLKPFCPNCGAVMEVE